ncbi:hypothetical protein E2562_037637 [Oryza meyeriana var. granulata]|uniref:Uncharacterized protein n=1 Tax=Oryza meyeriana var. granulata TaxID=110450 RepID=A0A6G1CLM4_9ORYZ|nr:hypothetical protein E2562_037637 [Oryza meyeriana var. granulata]
MNGSDDPDGAHGGGPPATSPWSDAGRCAVDDVTRTCTVGTRVAAAVAAVARGPQLPGVSPETPAGRPAFGWRHPMS